MPNDKDNHSGHAQNGGSRIFRNLSLLTLPWLVLQLDILELVKQGLQPKPAQDVAKGAGATEERQAEDKHTNGPKGTGYMLIKPIEHLVELEVHAVMMILDPSHALRNRFGADLEKKIVDELTSIIDKFAAGSVNLIEIQEIILNRIIEIAKRLKNEDKPKPNRHN